MQIEIPSEIDPNFGRQLENKLKEEMKDGLITKYATEFPDGMIRIEPPSAKNVIFYTGCIFNEQSEMICLLAIGLNLNVQLIVPCKENSEWVDA